MPPEPAYPSTVRAACVFQLGNGDVALNVLHFKTAPAGPQMSVDDATTLAQGIADSWTGLIQTHVSELTRFALIRVSDLRFAPHPLIEFNVDDYGTAVDAPMPYQNAVVASLHTALAGRSGRGRVFMSGFTEAANALDATVNNIVRAAIVDYIELLMDGFAGPDIGSMELAVLSRINVSSELVQTVSVDNRWDIQRRRANRRI